MQLWLSTDAIRRKYGATWAAKILSAAGDLGTVTDVSTPTPDSIRSRIAGAHVDVPHALIGGYDLMPAFVRANPSLDVSGDDDADIPTDSPYGATPGSHAEEFVPKRIVARIPDATGTADPADFVKLLRFQAQAKTAKTPTKRFEECAKEFLAPSQVVATAMAKGVHTIVTSPPATIDGAPDLVSRLAGAGRVHVLLHGANFSPDWAYLWGKGSKSDFVKAMSARQIDLCDLRGAVVTFSSCYAAMLDTGDSEAGRRSETNQVALACLGHGAKFVVAATRRPAPRSATPASRTSSKLCQRRMHRSDRIFSRPRCRCSSTEIPRRRSSTERGGV
jgi:hypothetical protein